LPDVLAPRHLLALLELLAVEFEAVVQARRAGAAVGTVAAEEGRAGLHRAGLLAGADISRIAWEMLTWGGFMATGCFLATAELVGCRRKPEMEDDESGQGASERSIRGRQTALGGSSQRMSENMHEHALQADSQ
jgi:hypothetical protein